MYTVLELLLKTLVELLPKYQSQRVGRNRKDLGKHLVNLYFQLVDIVVTGRQIVDQIQTEHNWYYSGEDKPFRAHPQGTKYWNEHISHLLYSQSGNLTHFETEFAEVLRIMYVLLPANEISSLSDILQGKKRIIRSLAHLLYSGKLPADLFGQTSTREDSLISNDAAAFKKLLISSTPSPEEFEMEPTEIEFDFFNTIEVGAIDIANQDNKAAVDRLVNLYLKSKPSERLDLLENYTEQIREIIKENFDLDEILWTIETAKKENRL